MLPIQSGALTLSASSEIGGVNEWITVTAPSTAFDWSGYGREWKDRYSFNYAQYMKVYKFNVEKGQNYTLYMKMPLDEGYMNINLTGISPVSESYPYVDGTISDFVMYFQQPWAPRSNNIDVYRKNFSVSESSDSTELYVICSFETPGKSFEFMLKTPKDSDDDVDNSTENPYVPDRNGYTWGGVLGTPVHLEASSGMVEETYHDESVYVDDTTYDETTYTEETYHNEGDFYSTEDALITTYSAEDAKLLSLNQEYNYSVALEVDTQNVKDVYLDDWATAYQLYKYQLQPGQKYTFDFMYNTFNNMNAYLIGENPMATNVSFQNDVSSNTIIAAFQEQPFASLGYDEWYASRTQFTTSSNSTGSVLYVLVRASYEGDPYKFKLTSGYLSSEEETYNPMQIH